MKELSVIRRGTKSNTVDIDLNMEIGLDMSISNISRRQVELRLDLGITYKMTTFITTSYKSEISYLPPTYSNLKSPILEPCFILIIIRKKKILVNNHSIGTIE